VPGSLQSPLSSVWKFFGGEVRQWTVWPKQGHWTFIWGVGRGYPWAGQCPSEEDEDEAEAAGVGGSAGFFPLRRAQSRCLRVRRANACRHTAGTGSRPVQGPEGLRPSKIKRKREGKKQEWNDPCFMVRKNIMCMIYRSVVRIWIRVVARKFGV